MEIVKHAKAAMEKFPGRSRKIPNKWVDEFIKDYDLLDEKYR